MGMASKVWSNSRASSIISSSSVSLRRRLPLVGALCMLSFGLANLTPSLSSSFKNPWSLSLYIYIDIIWVVDNWVGYWLNTIKHGWVFFPGQDLLNNYQWKGSILVAVEWKAIRILYLALLFMLQSQIKNQVKFFRCWIINYFRQFLFIVFFLSFNFLSFLLFERNGYFLVIKFCIFSCCNWVIFHC